MGGKYIQFSTGDDGVPRQNGLEPVKVRKKNQQYQHLQHSSMFTKTIASRCIRHLMGGKYIQFSTGDYGVPRQNGMEPVKVRKRNQQYQHLQHSSMFT